MDLIEQMIAQTRMSDSGPGQTPQAAAFFQGQETSLSRRRLEQNQQQIDAEMALLPIKIKEMEQQAEMRSLTIQKQIFERDNQIKAGKAALDGFSTISSMIREGETSARVTAAYADVLAENPFLPTEVRQGMETVVKTYESDSVRRDMAAERAQTQEQIAEARNANAIALAQLNSGSREKVAEIRADAQLDIAGTGAASREKVAEIRAEASETVAGIGADSKEAVAKIKGEYGLASARIKEMSRIKAESEKTTAGIANFNKLEELHRDIVNAPDKAAEEEALRRWHQAKNLLEKANTTEGKAMDLTSYDARMYGQVYFEVEAENPKLPKAQVSALAHKRIEQNYNKIKSSKPASVEPSRKASGSSTNAPYRYDPKLGRAVPQ